MPSAAISAPVKMATTPGADSAAAVSMPPSRALACGLLQDIGVELARPVDVVGIGPLSGEEPVVLAPPDWRADRSHRRYSAAAPWAGAGGASPRITAAPSMIASTMLW